MTKGIKKKCNMTEYKKSILERQRCSKSGKMSRDTLMSTVLELSRSTDASGAEIARIVVTVTSLKRQV